MFTEYRCHRFWSARDCSWDGIPRSSFLVVGVEMENWRRIGVGTKKLEEMMSCEDVSGGEYGYQQVELLGVITY